MYQSHFICCVSNYSFETLCPFHWKNETIANAISSLKHFKIPLIHDASHLSKLHIQTNIRALITTTTLKGDFIMKSSKQTAKLKNTMKKNIHFAQLTSELSSMHSNTTQCFFSSKKSCAHTHTATTTTLIKKIPIKLTESCVRIQLQFSQSGTCFDT